MAQRDQDRYYGYGPGRDPRDYGDEQSAEGERQLRQERRYGGGGPADSSGYGHGDEGAAGYFDATSRTGAGGGHVGSFFGPRGYDEDDRVTARGYEGSGRIGSAEYPGNPSVWEGEQGEYDYDYGGSHGQLSQTEFGGDMYGGGGYGLGPYERSEQYGGNEFPEGAGPYSDLQRQYEQGYVSGGYPSGWASGTGYGGRPDYSERQQGRFWQADYYPEPARRGERNEEGPYYGALGYRDREGRGAYGENPYGYYGQHRRQLHGGPQRGYAGLPEGGYGGNVYGLDEGRVQFRHEPQRAGRPARRGPKGYRRSDERIREDICERLAGSGHFGVSDLVNEHLDVSDVSVEVKDGRVTLEGTVPERRMKHLIEDIVEECACVQEVDNRIRVRRAEESDDDQRGSEAVRSADQQSPAQQSSGPNQGSERSRRL